MILTRINPSPLAPTDKLSYTDMEIGIPLMLVSVELVIFAVFFHFAYSYTPYLLTSYSHKPLAAGASGAPDHHPVDSASYHGGFLGVRAWAALLNPSDFVAAISFAFTMRSEADRAPMRDDSYGGRSAYQQTEMRSPPKHTYDSSYGRDERSDRRSYNDPRATETYNMA
jgi:hypothetical protein